MKKLIFIFAVSAIGLMFAIPAGARAQKISYPPQNTTNPKVEYPSQLNSKGTVKHHGYVISQDINPNEIQVLPQPGGQQWNGTLQNWPKKRPMRCEM